MVSFLPENPLPVKELFVGDAISSAPCRFWHSTCKAFIDDSCPLFTANFMCDLIHNITSWGYYLIGKRECHGTHGLPCTINVRFEIVADAPEIKKLISEFGKICRNLNQIARYFNQGGILSSEMRKEIKKCVGTIYEMKYEVMRMVREFRGARYGESR